MSYSFAFGKIILCSILVIPSFKTVECSGTFGIRLISYEDFHGKDKDGKCCDGFIILQNSTKICEPCDHFIFVCLLNARDHGKGPCVSNNVTTDTVNDSSNVTFGNSLGSYLNPFELRFNVSSMARVVVELEFKIYDDDRFDVPPTEPEMLEKISYAIFLIPPDSFNTTPALQTANIKTNQSRLIFDYWCQCDQYYYSPSSTFKCDTFCKPDPLRYDCTSSGSRHCKQEWIGPDCSTYNYCFNITCLHGGLCQNGASGFTCYCDSKYTGTMCETLITSTTATSQQMISTKSSTTVRPTSPSSPSTSLSTTTSSTARTAVPTSLTTFPSNPTQPTIKSATTQAASSLSLSTLTAKSSTTKATPPISLSTSTVKSTTKLSSRSQYLARHDKLYSKNTDQRAFPKNIWIFLASVAGGITLLAAGAYIVVYKKNQIGNTAR